MMIYSWMKKDLGQRYVGAEVKGTRLGAFVLVRNTVRMCWHLAYLQSGALLHTAGSRTEVRQLAKEAAPITREQRELAQEWAKEAEVLEGTDFFRRFEGYGER
jgi:hypothetical protein